jgi:hypothetical protein
LVVIGDATSTISGLAALGMTVSIRGGGALREVRFFVAFAIMGVGCTLGGRGMGSFGLSISTTFGAENTTDLRAIAFVTSANSS